MDVYWERHGAAKPGTTPAVLVMGLGTDLHGWERVLPAVAAEREVIVLDNRGVGRSAKPPGPYTTAQLAADVIAVMDAAGLARAHVAGLSLGGMIAQELVLAYPARLASLALVATYARADQGTKDVAAQGAAAARFDMRALMEAMAGAGPGPQTLDVRAMMGFLMQLVFTPKFIETERAYLKAFFDRSMSYGFVPQAFAGQTAAALHHDAYDRLPAIATPTLVVTGTRDRLIPPRHSRVLVERIAGARLAEIDGGSHGINLERPAELATILGDWFRSRD